MSLAEIEAELHKLDPAELRRLALVTWAAYLDAKAAVDGEWCDETDPELLNALDESLRESNAPGAKKYTCAEARQLLAAWTTR